MNPPPLPGIPPVPRQKLLVWLNLVLALFLLDAGLSFLDDLSSFGRYRPFMALRAICSLLMLLVGLTTYAMLGFCPSIPKRWFVPISLFGPAMLLLLPLLSIYWYARLPVLGTVFSGLQVLLGVWLIWSTQRELRWRWPLIREEHLVDRPFRWPRLLGFGLLNVGVVLPGIAVYFALCVHLAVDRFSAGFLRLDTSGISGISKKYTRGDGKVVHLIPMMHIGESRFYQELTRSIPTNSIILLEGVSDRKGRLKNQLSYQRMAESVGLQEQKDEFEPDRGLPRNADIDVSEFSATTLELLNLVVAYHAKGGSPELIRELMEKGQDLSAIQGLWDDLLTRRNTHLLKEVKQALTESGIVLVPWGAAHMPGVAAGIEADGFKVIEVQRHRIAQFRTMWERIRAGKPSTAP